MGSGRVRTVWSRDAADLARRSGHRPVREAHTWVGLFADLDSDISLALLERYPSPDVRGLGEKRLQAFLGRRHYRGRQKPAQLLAKLRLAPQGRVGEAEMNARRPRRSGSSGRSDQHGFITAAQMLAEIGDCRARYPPATRSPATPARPRSRSSRANAKPHASAGGATNGCAPRFTHWLTQPATGCASWAVYHYRQKRRGWRKRRLPRAPRLAVAG